VATPPPLGVQHKLVLIASLNLEAPHPLCHPTGKPAEMNTLRTPESTTLNNGVTPMKSFLTTKQEASTRINLAIVLSFQLDKMKVAFISQTLKDKKFT